MADLPAGLLEAVKNDNDMTWTLTSEETSKLTGIISRGMSRIDDIIGKSLDYTVEAAPRELLMAYVKYERAGKLHLFEDNNRYQLIRLAATAEVSDDT